MSIYEDHKPVGGGLFLKLAGGDSVKARLYSEPAIFESLFEKDGESNLSTKYAWLMWNQDAQIPQILQGSASIFNQIAQLARNSDWGDPTGYDLTIKREGSGFTDTKYIVTPSPNKTPLLAAAKEALKDIDLLEKLKSGKGVQRAHMLAEWEEMQAHPKKSAAQGTDANSAENAAKDVVVEPIDGEPVNLDDIPF